MKQKKISSTVLGGYVGLNSSNLAFFFVYHKKKKKELKNKERAKLLQ
jgi:hypothetical protein